MKKKNKKGIVCYQTTVTISEAARNAARIFCITQGISFSDFAEKAFRELLKKEGVGVMHPSRLSFDEDLQTLLESVAEKKRLNNIPDPY